MSDSLTKATKELQQFWKDKKLTNKMNKHINYLNKNDFVPFIGSGMSVPFGFKRWGNFLDHVMKYVQDGEVKRRCTKKLQEESYWDVADILAETQIVELSEFVREEFGKEETTISEYENYLHYLAKTDKIKTIVTTNFDPLIEKHLNIKQDNVFSPSNMVDPIEIKRRIDSGNNKVIIKLHGTYSDAGSIVLTKEKFSKSYLPDKSDSKILEFIWNSSNLLFIGCGLSSKDYLIEKMQELKNDKKSGDKSYRYAILEYPDKNKIRDREKKLQSIGIQPIWFEKGKYEQIILILKMILGIKDEYEYKPDHDFDLKFVDQLVYNKDTKEIINEELQKKIISAISTQCENKNEYGKNNIVDWMYNNYIAEPINHNFNSRHQLSIEGESGTGKSTILSLLYLKCLLESEKNKTRPFLIDVHYYDNKEKEKAIQDLKTYLKKIEEKIKDEKNKKFILFVDGRNPYEMGDLTLEREIINWIEESKNFMFVYSIGTLNNKHYPTSIRRTNLWAPKINNTVRLKPVNIKNIDALVSKTIEYYGYLKNKDYSSLKEKFCKQIEKLKIQQVDFRIVLRLIRIYNEDYKESSDFFTDNIGKIFNEHYQKHNDISSISEYIVNILFCENNNVNSSIFYYPFKSETVINYHIAYFYIKIIKEGSINKLKQLGCIFTRGINIFAVDLMNICDDPELIIDHIIEFIDNEELPLLQKSQLAFMLGRVKNDNAAKKARDKLNLIYDEYIKNEYKLNDYEGIYLRTVGISLIALKENRHTNEFYKKLIYNGSLNRINSNFYIRYFITDGFRLEKELEIENTDVCTLENMRKLYDYLYSTLNKEEINEVNIITILNITTYELFFKENEIGDNMKNLVTESREVIKKTRALLPLKEVIVEYVNFLEKIIGKDIYYEILSGIYQTKDNNRKGWTENRFHVGNEQKYFADHTWACCQLALLFLPENPNNCRFMEKKEKYNLSNIMLILVAYDLQYLSDHLYKILSLNNNDKKKKKAQEVKLEKFDALPPFCTFQFIDALNKNQSYDFLLANDINSIEPLLQMFIYKCVHPGLLKLNGDNNEDDVIQAKINEVVGELSTAFGNNLLDFLVRNIFNKHSQREFTISRSKQD